MSDLNNNKELQAISRISESLQGLDEEAVTRILAYVNDKYGPKKKTRQKKDKS